MDAAKDGLGHDEDDGEDHEQELIQGVQKKRTFTHEMFFNFCSDIFLISTCSIVHALSG